MCAECGGGGGVVCCLSLLRLSRLVVAWRGLARGGGFAWWRCGGGVLAGLLFPVRLARGVLLLSASPSLFGFWRFFSLFLRVPVL